MSVEATIQSLLEESRKLKQLDENVVTKNAVAAEGMKKLDADQSAEDEPSNKKNNVVTQKAAEGGTSKTANRATQGAVAPEAMPKLKEDEEVDLDEEQIDELSQQTLRSYHAKAGSDLQNKKEKLSAGTLTSKEHKKGQDRFKGLNRSAAKMEEVEESETVAEEKVDMSADVDALFNGEEGLTEEFRQKAETIFEAAVTSRIKEEVARITESLEEQYEEKLQEAIEEKIEGLVEHVDGYLNLMVEQWMEDNAVALESGMKSDILESFVSGMKNLFQEHYIEVPEEKFDVLESMKQEVETLKAKLNESFEKNIDLMKEINESRRQEIIATVCEGLTDIEADKLQTLAEEISFEDSESFATKMQTIRENYFAKTVKKEVPSIITEETIQEEKVLTSDMSRYVKAISMVAK